MHRGREYFSEKQKYSSAWLYVIAFEAAVIGSIFFFFVKPDFSDITTIIPMVVVIILMTATVWVFVFSKLEILIDNEGIHYRFPVMHPGWKTVFRDEIMQYEIRIYDAISEFGGWGMRRSRKKGRYMAVHGDKATATHPQGRRTRGNRHSK